MDEVKEIFEKMDEIIELSLTDKPTNFKNSIFKRRYEKLKREYGKEDKNIFI